MAFDCPLGRNTNGTRYRTMYLEENEEEENYDCFFEDQENDCAPEACKDAESKGESKICRVFVDGSEADYDICEDEDSLLERVWWMSKPPKIPKRTCVVSARRIQVMKECLSSTINARRALCDIMRDKGPKHARKKHIDGGMQYVKVHIFDGKPMASCQEETQHIIPACAQTLDEILKT